MAIIRLITGILFFSLGASVIWAASTDEEILLNAGDIVVTTRDFQQRLLLFPEAERTQVLGNPNSIKDLLRQIYQNKYMVAAAEQLKLNDDPIVQAKLVLEKQRILAEALREHIRKQIQSPDFATLAREHYAARHNEFHLPERFKAAHILKRVQCACERDSQRQTIEQLLARLRVGEDFATLAKVESDDTSSAAQGGDLGRWVTREDLVAPFADALIPLEPGQISGTVETEFGFHIIKKLDSQPARLQDFDEVRENLERHLRQTYVDDQLVQRSADYLPPVDAQFNETALEALQSSH